MLLKWKKLEGCLHAKERTSQNKCVRGGSHVRSHRADTSPKERLESAMGLMQTGMPVPENED